MKHCIVNFSDFRFKAGQDRLYKSLKDFHYQGDILLFDSFQELGCKTHQEVHYQFKVYAIEKVRQMGYDVVLWCDASMFAVKDVMPVLNHIYDKGYLMEYCGFSAGQWSTDICLQEFGITRDEAMDIPLHSSGFTGLNFQNNLSNEFLDKWFKYAQAEITFNGDWTNNNNQCSMDSRCLGHRHDQTTASIIAHQIGMERINPHFMQYKFEGVDLKEETHFYCQGII